MPSCVHTPYRFVAAILLPLLLFSFGQQTTFGFWQQPTEDSKAKIGREFDLLDSSGQWIIELSDEQIDALKEQLDLEDKLTECSLLLDRQAAEADKEDTSPAHSDTLRAASSILIEIWQKQFENHYLPLSTILTEPQMEAFELYHNNETATYLNTRKKLDANAFISLGQAMLRIAERESIEAFRGISRAPLPPAKDEPIPEDLFQFGEYWFHSQQISLSRSSWKQIENTLESTETYQGFVQELGAPGLGKFCGKFHPNLYLRFTAKDKSLTHVLVCLGCNEIRFIFNDIQFTANTSAKAGEAFIRLAERADKILGEN